MALSGVLHLGSVGNCCSQQPAKLHGHTLKTNRFLRCGSPASRGHKCCYTITLETPEGSKEITCKQSEYIFYAAEAAGVDLPISCRAGACSSCTALLKSGSVDQFDQTFLSKEQEAEGFVLTCMACPTSDCTLKTHQEKLLYV